MFINSDLVKWMVRHEVKRVLITGATIGNSVVSEWAGDVDELNSVPDGTHINGLAVMLNDGSIECNNVPIATARAAFMFCF